MYLSNREFQRDWMRNRAAEALPAQLAGRLIGTQEERGLKKASPRDPQFGVCQRSMSAAHRAVRSCCRDLLARGRAGGLACQHGGHPSS